MMQTFSFSDKGPRTENQDFFYLGKVNERILAAVADGVGGNKGGETASRIAVEVFTNKIQEGASLAECMDSAHNELLKIAENTPSLQGMATTLTAITCDQNILTGIHCGDSRAYLLRRNGIMQLTTDHTEVARLLTEGRLTKEEAVNYPRSNVLTSALGTHKEFKKQVFNFDLLPNDRLLLLSDGVYSKISKYEIQLISSQKQDFSSFCNELISIVVERGTTDNYTLLGLQFD